MTHAYGVYNAFQSGPNYRADKGYLDVRSGTVFDADTDPADEGIQPSSQQQDQGAQGSDAGFEDNTDYGVDMGGPAYDY